MRLLLFRGLTTVRAPVGAIRSTLASFYSTSTPEIHKIDGRNTLKPIFSRKTFLIDYYKHLNDTNQIMVYVHHNNLPKKDNNELRSGLTKLGAKFNVITNNLYRVYLRSAHEEDPALKANSIKNKKVEHPLAPLLNGPNAIISIPTCEPAVVAQILKLLQSYKDKIFVVGARVETSVFDSSEIKAFKDLPNKVQLQGQLAGMLTVLGGAGLVKTLEASANVLYLTLDERRKDIEDNKE